MMYFFPGQKVETVDASGVILRQVGDNLRLRYLVQLEDGTEVTYDEDELTVAE